MRETAAAIKAKTIRHDWLSFGTQKAWPRWVSFGASQGVTVLKPYQNGNLYISTDTLAFYVCECQGRTALVIGSISLHSTSVQCHSLDHSLYPSLSLQLFCFKRSHSAFCSHETLRKTMYVAVEMAILCYYSDRKGGLFCWQARCNEKQHCTRLYLSTGVQFKLLNVSPWFL